MWFPSAYKHDSWLSLGYRRFVMLHVAYILIGNVNCLIVCLSDVLMRNCTPPAIDDFPSGLFTDVQRQHGAIVLHAFISLYLFIALAVVCDKFFVPAVDRICHGSVSIHLCCAVIVAKYCHQLSNCHVWHVGTLNRHLQFVLYLRL